MATFHVDVLGYHLCFHLCRSFLCCFDSVAVELLYIQLTLSPSTSYVSEPLHYRLVHVKSVATEKIQSDVSGKTP
jgi:hypothetical protein